MKLLGPTDLRGSDGSEVRSILARPKRLALLAYLALQGPERFQRREKLAGLLWERSSEAKARSSLSVTLHHLRRALGGEVVLKRGSEEVAVSGALELDVRAFLGAASEGDLERAVDLYRGPLLDGFHLARAPTFTQWLEHERDRLHVIALDSLGRLVDERSTADGDRVRAWARRAVQLAPYDDSSVHRLVDLLARSGHRAEAMRVYRRFERRLRKELELLPSAETRALIERIRSGESLGPRAHAAPGAQSDPAPGRPPTSESPSADTVPSTPVRRLRSSIENEPPSRERTPTRPPRGRVRKREAIGAAILTLTVASLLVVMSGNVERNAESSTASRVLWVDDNPENNAEVVAQLEELGVRVITATSTAEALVAYDPDAIDLVVSDMGRFGTPTGPYQERAGLELYGELSRRHLGVRFVICTSHRAAETHGEHARALGVEEVLTDCGRILDIVRSPEPVPVGP